MPWKPLPSVAFAICVYPFHATEPKDLPLQVGDHIYIIEQGGKNSDWCRGYLVSPPSLLSGLNKNEGQQLEHRVFSGIFPKNCVEIREVLGDNKQARQSQDGSPTSPRVNGWTPVERQDEWALKEKRKSQRVQARRLSRALSRKRSTQSVKDKTRPQLVDIHHDPMPRAPNAPKPKAPVPLLRVGDEAGLSTEEPLVDEIASCLREWHDARLHELLLSRRYTQLSRIQDLIKRVDTNRKRLMHDVMTMKELGQLREDTVWDLVAGNKLLSDEVIVRSPSEKGRIMTAEDSVIEMTKLQANMNILDRPPKPPADPHMLYHILVDVRTLVCDLDSPAALQVYLCSKAYGEKPLPLTENFTVTTPLSDGESKAPEDQPKTLFINLSAHDLGHGNESSSLYLVFKMLKEEPVRRQPPPQVAQPVQPPAISQPQPRNSLRTRRSLFGSQRKLQENRPSTGNSSERPDTARTASSTSESTTPAQEVKTVRRTIGVGAIEIGTLARSHAEITKKVTMWQPAPSFDARNDEGEEWDDIIRELGRSNTGGFSRLTSVKRFDLFAQTFAATDLPGLIRTTPTLLHDIHTTHKLGFSGRPTEERSDIYLTLTEPLLPRNAHMAHPKFGQVPLAQRCQTSLANLQLTLEVRKRNGERVEDCIFTSSNHQGHTAWRTTGIEKGEGWHQTVRLAVPTEDVPGSHIVMSIADSPNFPFALAWIPMWEEEAFVRDGNHQVTLYVYDEYTSSMIGGRGAYLALPPWHRKEDFTQVNAATVSMRTYLCSTEYSQDPNLLGLLSWRKYHGAKLIELLERFPFIPEIEVVKLLKDVFTALFEILDEYTRSEQYEDLVFYNLIVIFGIANDRRFDLRNVVEDYAMANHHDHSFTCQSMLRAFQRLVSSPMDPEASRKLRAALKVGDQMLRLIIETRKSRPEHADEHTMGNGDVVRYATFGDDLQKLFVAIMALMRNPMPVLLGTQTLVVQRYHTFLPELVSVLGAQELLEVARDFMDSFAHCQGSLVMHRLVLINNLSQTDLFKRPDVRDPFVANTFRWLAPYWGTVDDVTEQWRSQVRLCCKVVATQMIELNEESCQYVPKLVESYTALQQVKRAPKKTFSMLFPATYPFPERRAAEETDVDEAMLEMSALLAAALTSEQRLYFDANEVDIPGVLLQALKVGQSILVGEAFPASWLSLYVSHHRYGISALERIQELLLESLSDSYAPDADEAFDFDTVLWKQYFDTLFAAVSSPALAMETFPEQKRRAIWKIGGDVRELGAQLIQRSWDAIGWETDEDTRKLHGFKRLGGYQVQFVPDLVEPVVELCLSMHASLRSVAVQVLTSMLIGAWELDQDLGIIQSAMIDCLDRLVRNKHLTEAVLQKHFIAEILANFKPYEGMGNEEDGDLHAAVVAMFNRIERLLGMLGSVHSSKAANDATQIVDTLRLMTFLRNTQSERAYIRYVHQLADMMKRVGDWTSAGLALKLEADMYEWDPMAQLPADRELSRPDESAFRRKENLYMGMVQYYEHGHAWHLALEALKTLAHQYEYNVFDPVKMARTQREMATIYENISKGDTSKPRYFRIAYRGHGWQPIVQNKVFIYEGFENDRLATVEDRMKRQHPGVQITRRGVLTEHMPVEGCWLSITTVSIQKDMTHPIYQRTKIPPVVRDYYILSSPQKFSVTTREENPNVPITEQKVTKTIYTTEDAFPTILRRSEIVKKEEVTLTPLEAALERTIRKTQDLIALEADVLRTGHHNTRSDLSDQLMLSCDPESESSVSRYRSLLPGAAADNASDAFDPAAAEEATPELSSLQSALRVALLDHVLIIRRCLYLYVSSAHIATRAQLIPRFEATFAPEIAELFPGWPGILEMDFYGLQAPQSPVYASPDISSGPAAAAATTDDATIAGADQGEPETPARGRRRRSFSFLRRGSSISSLRGQQTSAGGEEQRPSSRARSSSRSRFSLRRN